MLSMTLNRQINHRSSRTLQILITALYYDFSVSRYSWFSIGLYVRSELLYNDLKHTVQLSHCVNFLFIILCFTLFLTVLFHPVPTSCLLFYCFTLFQLLVYYFTVSPCSNFLFIILLFHPVPTSCLLFYCFTLFQLPVYYFIVSPCSNFLFIIYAFSPV
jgi:hypothetical protein